MTEYEIFTVVLSFILGLGIAQILSSCVHAVQSRREMTLRWIPFLWAFSIFAFHITFLFGTLNFYSQPRPAVWYWVDLGGAVLLFLSGGLLMPSQSHPLPEDLLVHFGTDGRLALVPLGLYSLSAIPYNLAYDIGVFGAPNLIHYALLLLLIAAFMSRRTSVRGVMTIGFAALTWYGALFVWARPGATVG